MHLLLKQSCRKELSCQTHTHSAVSITIYYRFGYCLVASGAGHCEVCVLVCFFLSLFHSELVSVHLPLLFCFYFCLLSDYIHSAPTLSVVFVMFFSCVHYLCIVFVRATVPRGEDFLVHFDLPHPSISPPQNFNT